MCATCGCGIDHEHSLDELHDHSGGHEHDHDHDHDHGDHDHGHESADSVDGRIITLEQDVLRRNDHLAQHNREWLSRRGLVAVNFVSSPGSGKTSLLENVIRRDEGRGRIAVIQGDQATDRDAERVRAAGARAVQLNTGTGCHLDAQMVARALEELAPEPGTLVAIENIGNLVCPALFDLGEQARLALMSVPEGADKPLKYPYMFRGASLVVLNKIDLLPHVEFDVGFFRDCLRQVNPDVSCLEVSATRGDGLSELMEWLAALCAPASAEGETA